MPYYDYTCGNCDRTFEKKLIYEKCLDPESEPCPICGVIDVVHYVPSGCVIGDPIRLHITKPDAQFREGVLQRIKNTVPNGTRVRPDGKTVINKVDLKSSYV